MIPARAVLAALALVAAFHVGSAAPTPTPGPSAPAITLFNGRDLDGWRLFLADSKTDPAATSVTPDGVLHVASKLSGYLVTEGKFSNYRLHVEWRWPADSAPNANSGVLVHLAGPDAIWPARFECQLKIGNAGQVVGTGLDIPAAPLVNHRKRAPRLAEPSEKPLGEWNTYEIYCRGDTIEVFVDGVRQNRVEKLPVKAGAIGLQLEGSALDFRNVWLAPL